MFFAARLLLRILLVFAESPSAWIIWHATDFLMKTALTIAGFDPSSGAGITADLMVFAAHGLFGISCITALTVQSTVGVMATQAVDAEVVRATLDCLQADLPVAGIKIGMLATAATVLAVAGFLEERQISLQAV